MPADRSKSKKASSSRRVLTHAKSINYADTPLPAHAILFAPNVTPGTYLDTDAGAGPSREQASTSDALSPAVETTSPTPSRRREPRGKSRSQGHIPRPPNAFILFRSDFLKSDHPVQQGNLTLSRITGDAWHSLLPEEKQEWEEKARLAKEEHAQMYPKYKYQPVHNKKKKAAKRRAKAGMLIEEKQRSDEVAQLLLDRKRGDELVAALCRVDTERQRTASNTPEAFAGLNQWAPPAPVQPAPYYGSHRRTSSAPVPSQQYNSNMLPSHPFLLPIQPQVGSRAPSPVRNISHVARNTNARRAASVQAIPRPSWTYPIEVQPSLHMPVPAPMPPTWQHNWSSVPEPDASLFEPAYVHGGSSFSQAQNDYDFPACPPIQRQRLSLEIEPLDCGPLGIEGYSDVPPFTFSSAPNPISAFPYHAPFAHGPMHNTANSSNNGWMPASGSTSILSGSPAPSAHAFSYALNAGLLAQQLEMEAEEQGWMQQRQMVEPSQQQYDLGGTHDFGAQLQLQVEHAAPAHSTVVQPSELQQYASMGLPVDECARVPMGEPSGSGSGPQQGWYPSEEQLGRYEGMYARGIYEGELNDDIFGLGEGAQDGY